MAPFRRKPQGVALIIVLSFLVLISVMVIGFLGRMTTERSATASYFETNRGQLLADTAVNIVRAQIDHASSERDGGRTVAWASQPGMVRTFRADGSLLRAYKLYSDSSMVAESVNPATAASELSGWWSNPALYVDLNAPVLKQNDDGSKQFIYPIVDNAALDTYTEADNGFKVVSAPVNAGDVDSSLGQRQRIPMPVKWLYVLEDGSTVAPTAASGSTVTVPGASRNNPIVGRIAFWTDDETSKLNINTASHGSFWDIPRVSSIEDRERFARFHPVRNEFQRYPGHPAMTTLRPAFDPTLFASDNDFAQFAYGIAPRIQDGGSKGGTARSDRPVTLDTDRLYSSIDELLYAPDRSEQLTPEVLEKAKFFLTARSNAPEVNQFNLPRMAIWPINAGTKTPSTLDQLIAFCSTINGKQYYLQRSNPSSATEDMMGFGGRNMALWNYINYLLEQPIPGFGNTSFANKVTSEESKQIVTQIFDYIRSSNLYSTSLGATAYTGDVNVAPASVKPPLKPGTRVGQVTPIKIAEYKGFGRIPMLSRAVFQLFLSGAEMYDDNGNLVDTWIPRESNIPGNSAKAVPAYSANHSLYDSWKNFLQKASQFETGTGTERKSLAKVRLLTTGIVYFDTFDPNLGYVMPRYRYEIDVNFSGAWQVGPLSADKTTLLKPMQSLGFTGGTIKVNLDHNRVYNSGSNNVTNIFFPRVLGGLLGPHWMMMNYAYLNYPNPADRHAITVSSTADNVNYGNILSSKGGYPLVSNRVPIHVDITPKRQSDGTYTLPNWNELGDDLTPYIQFSGGSLVATLKAGGAGGNGGDVVQTYQFEFPAFIKPAPAYLDDNTRSNRNTSVMFNKDKQFPVSAEFRYRWFWSFHQHIFYDPAATPGADRDRPDIRLVQSGDVAVSLVPRLGDKRLLAAKSTLTSSGANADFTPQAYYNDSEVRAAVDFRSDIFGRHAYRRIQPPYDVLSQRTGRLLDLNYGHNALPDIPGHFRSGVKTGLGLAFDPDFDNVPFYLPDDAYINRADEGSVTDVEGDVRRVAWYYDNTVNDTVRNNQNLEEYFSPARQMPSAVMFGSLPTGVKRNLPWQTLLFRPDPGSHPGAANPPDYALLDLFWMPVVEPYSISEPFSTNGKINMNFQIMPFTYIHRATALHGLLKNEEMLVVPNSAAGNGTVNVNGIAANDDYKLYDADGTNAFSNVKFRRKIDVQETLKGFYDKFDSGSIFHSETEICSLWMIPEGASWSTTFGTWWRDYQLTGDNSRERVYAHLLPRLTTRSNTYTVHFRVQTLRRLPAATDAEAATWREGRDVVTSEYRGSRTIERYIDPNDTNIPDFATNLSLSPNLSSFYRWRDLSNREFAP